MVESVTARVSVLPDVGSELPTVYEVGNDALDEVGLSWTVVFPNGFGGYFAGFAR